VNHYRLDHIDLTVADAAHQLAAELLPPIKHAIRCDAPLSVIDDIEHMEELAAVLGEREHLLARAIRREWARLLEEPTARQRAAVIAGLVELGERASKEFSRPQER
jgi:hypothetical protein